jgi:hypothetical protein
MNDFFPKRYTLLESYFHKTLIRHGLKIRGFFMSFAPFFYKNGFPAKYTLLEICAPQ